MSKRKKMSKRMRDLNEWFRVIWKDIDGIKAMLSDENHEDVWENLEETLQRLYSDRTKCAMQIRALASAEAE
jgi:hypothetical protein